MLVAFQEGFAMSTPTYTHSHLHVTHRIRAGRAHCNVLPPAPEGRKLMRIWTVIDGEKLNLYGPIHNFSAFLEDRFHDWLLNSDGTLRFYSRVVGTDDEVEVVLDYETIAEQTIRRSTPVFDPMTGKRLNG